MTNRTPDLLKELDPRVFSEYSLVFYDQSTLDVAQVLKSIPRGIDLDRLQDGIAMGKLAVGLFKGEVPKGSRKKFVGGSLIALSDPNLTISLNTPFAIRGDEGSLTPLILKDETYKLTVRSLVENGRVYRYRVDHPLRINASNGMLSQNHLGSFRGKYSIKYKSVGIKCGELVHIKVESPFLRETILEVYCTENNF